MAMVGNQAALGLWRQVTGAKADPTIEDLDVNSVAAISVAGGVAACRLQPNLDDLNIVRTAKVARLAIAAAGDGSTGVFSSENCFDNLLATQLAQPRRPDREKPEIFAEDILITARRPKELASWTRAMISGLEYKRWKLQSGIRLGGTGG